MKITKPNLPVGSSAKWIFVRSVWFMLWGGKFPLHGEGAVKVQVRSGEYWISVSLPPPQAVPVPLHPFKVMLSTAHDAAEDWRTFRVRAGAYGTTPVLGTDGADIAAGGNVAEGVNDVDDTATEVEDTAYNADFDIIVPDATLAYYIWIDAATDPAEPVIDHGATIPGGGTDDDWWNGSGYILIAIIDTATLTATKVAKRRQFVRDDIPKCPTT